MQAADELRDRQRKQAGETSRRAIEQAERDHREEMAAIDAMTHRIFAGRKA